MIARLQVDDGAVCVICGATDLLGLTVCPDCGGTDPRVADRLLFVSGGRGIRTREVRARIAEITGLPHGAEPVESAARGLRALARVPAASAPLAIRRLAECGIPAAARLPGRVWASLPFGFVLLLMVAIATGVWAGSVAAPLLLVTTPLFAGTVLVSAVRGIRRPIHPYDPPPPAPGALVALLAALTELPAGRARDLLAGLTRSVRGVTPVAALPPDMLAQLEALLPVAARAARDLAMIDDTLARLQREQTGSEPETVRNAVTELTRARGRLSEYLLEVTGLVGRLQGASADALASAGARLRELAGEFRSALVDHVELPHRR